jgi:hypothetical protein
MPKDWTTEDLQNLTSQQLLQLHWNAETRSRDANPKISTAAAALLPKVDEEIARRQLSKASKPNGRRRVPSSEKGRVEREYANHILSMVEALTEKFDLSKETATQLSIGIRNFRARNTIGRGGDALLGGAQRAGKVWIDRYTAYRVKDVLVSFSVILERDDPFDGLKFIVQAPERLLAHPQSLSAIRNTADNQASLEKGEMGEVFPTFGEAADAYERILSEIAPEQKKGR